MANVNETQPPSGGQVADASGSVCRICGAPLAAGVCPACPAPTLSLDVRRSVAPAPALSPLPPRVTVLVPQFDRLLVLAAVFALVSLYLPWLPGLYGPVPGWKVPYATTDVPLDEIRHLESVTRPESLFLLNFAGIVALIFCRTSRHAGIRDLVAVVLLVTGAGYMLLYFAEQWGWCLSYNYVGPYAAFTSLGIMVISGVLRPRFMPWVPRTKVLFLLAASFLLTGLFLPWSLDHIGLQLMLVVRDLTWIGVPEVFAYLILVFPVLGFVSFVMAFRDVPRRAHVFWRLWAIVPGLVSLIYFKVMWASYLAGWSLGSWGVLIGLTILTAAGFLDAFRTRPVLARVLMLVFLIVSVFVWLPFVVDDLGARLNEFFGPAPRFF